MKGQRNGARQRNGGGPGRWLGVVAALAAGLVLGRAAEIALTGSARGAADRIALTLDARQKDEAGLRALADLAYAVNDRTLKLSMDVSEPKDGLLGSLLQLPGNPAIDISIAGEGPLER